MQEIDRSEQTFHIFAQRMLEERTTENEIPRQPRFARERRAYEEQRKMNFLCFVLLSLIAF